MEVFEETSNAQFENLNGLRKYPFAESASIAGKDGKEFPLDVVVDLHLFVRSDMQRPSSGFVVSGKPVARLISAHLSQSMVSVCFSSVCGNYKDFLSVTVARERFEPYVPYRLEVLSGSEDSGGIVTFGDIDFPGTQETYFFDDAEISPFCISASMPAALRSVIDPRSGSRISGDVNIRFSGYVVSEKNGNSFKLSLEDGAGSELASECAIATGPEVCGATPISSINGVFPDEEGNIVLWFH